MSFDYPDSNSWLINVDCDKFNANTDLYRNLSIGDMDEDLSHLKREVKIKIYKVF
ncbi:hypothetical protein AGMMS50293_05620 [Spirochaetia bacterium]|nr:hypothetical protein AGMMS50293_05620 [Spirochaetia bacterium]